MQTLKACCCADGIASLWLTYLTVGVTRVFEPLIEAVLVYKLDGSRALAWVKQGIVCLCFQTAYSTYDLLLFVGVNFRLHVLLFSAGLEQRGATGLRNDF